MQEDSPQVFASLRQGGIETVMITGDSPYTAVLFIYIYVPCLPLSPPPSLTQQCCHTARMSHMRYTSHQRSCNHRQVHVARQVCLGIEPLQAHAARFILADLPTPSSSTPSAAVSWTDLSTLLPVPENEAIHDLSAAAARIAAMAADQPVPPPSDVRMCVTGPALAVMWDNHVCAFIIITPHRTHTTFNCFCWS
jgi:hypothetical protein